MSFPASSQGMARRSFTLPARTAKRPASVPASTNSADGIETLFICSNSKILSFTAAGPAPPIAWKTPTERTLAVGVLRIYRVTASNVSFLNSGNLLHTIFPRSQCWCVDNQSVFVLRIRQDSYYRMELPHETQDDRDKIAQFKSVLSQVMQYERTQCPFARGFEVDINEPARPKSPPRRIIRRMPSQKAKKWVMNKTWVPEPHGPRPCTPATEGSDAGTTSSYEEDDRSSIHTDSSEIVPESPEVAFAITLPKPLPSKALPPRPSVAERASIFQGLRSVTAPVKTHRTASVAAMKRILESPSAERPSEVEKPVLERNVSDAVSLASSADSFYSLDTATPRTPSPKSLDAEADLLNPWANSFSAQQDEPRGRSTHRRQTSDVTVLVSSSECADPSAPVTPTAPFYPNSVPTIDVRPSSAPSTPPLVSDSDDDSVELASLDIPTPPDAIRMRRLTGASQTRAFSPMPPTQNLFCPPKRNPGKDFTNALVRKTCELVLGPPAHLVSIMLRIATSISNGFGFSTYRVRRTEKIPCSWESDEETEWAEEDDFGIPLNNIGDAALRRRTFSGEVD
ncbi:hypothetical protein EJ02DRAFT_369110 [Clathrospora elynae]|uniref:Inheritance of peroxisomes protein 1 n=1 Tax=Clathrospora elynae TaxID=706981 RepID=A0A6A5SYD9_9PLEO|nr:hypothetical protein EJ02DRAFT_369110 [Clathrospora elynae]